MICLTVECLRIAILKLECESESSLGHVKAQIAEPFLQSFGFTLSEAEPVNLHF